jgi:AcrR family transcriptional regulator
VSRPAKFDEGQILDSTRGLVAMDGPAAATISAIVRTTRAPTGSIYHRFESRDVLVGEVWLRAAEAFQDAYFDILRGTPARDAGLSAALFFMGRVRTDLAEARVLLLHRREDFVDRGWPPAMEARAKRLKDQVDTELRDFSRRLCGRADPRTLRLLMYAILDVPFATVRRHVAANETPPTYLDLPMTVTYRAVLPLLDVLADQPEHRDEGRAARDPLDVTGLPSERRARRTLPKGGRRGRGSLKRSPMNPTGGHHGSPRQR